jgi:hypothetical protein
LAYWSWKDISAFTYNSTDLKAFLHDGFTVSLHATMQEHQPAGVAWPAPNDTGMRTMDPLSVSFLYDGTATGPCVKAALGTSAALSITHATGHSVSGTFIVSDAELGIAPDGNHTWNVTLTPSGTVTTDFAD